MIRIVKDTVNEFDLVTKYNVYSGDKLIGFAELVEGYYIAYAIDDNYCSYEISKIRANHVDDKRELRIAFVAHFGSM